MAYTIVTDICAGVSECAAQCPVACIHQGGGTNIKGTAWYWIDFEVCIDCGVCLVVCPVQGAVLPEQKSELQKTPQF